jgi:predicted RNase H-like HicB family nuclease
MGDNNYTVIYQQEPEGWTAEVPAIDGCHTWGRTLAEAEGAAREAIALCLDVPDSGDLDHDLREAGVELYDEIRLDGVSARELHELVALRREIEHRQRELAERTRLAATTLVDEAHLTMRDAATALGVSHQRIAQLVRS